MREILFRGQTRRKGEKVWMDGTPVESNWVYGGIFPGTGDFSVIYTFDPIEKRTVYSDTIGQFTGLTDKNGKKIFEGDIVKWDAKDELYPATVGYVYFDAQELAWMVRWQQYDPDFLAELDMPCVSVVGNIHDNPELVGVE